MNADTLETKISSISLAYDDLARKRADTERQLSEIDNEMFRYQGEYRAYVGLRDDLKLMQEEKQDATSTTRKSRK